MGIILDSSVIITAERRGHSVRQILEQVQTSQAETEIGLSVVTVAELVHGAYRNGLHASAKKRPKMRLDRNHSFPLIVISMLGFAIPVAWGVGFGSRQQIVRDLYDIANILRSSASVSRRSLGGLLYACADVRSDS